MKRTLSTFVFAAFILLHAHAQKSPVYVDKGKAIHGYDAVAFFTDSKPVMGKENLTCQYNGATWYFADQQHLESFKANPEKYAPQYGGYCAYGTSQGHKAPTEVETWTVVDGKLYFNYNAKVKEMWVKDQLGFIKKADEQWPMIKDKQ